MQPLTFLSKDLLVNAKVYDMANCK